MKNTIFALFFVVSVVLAGYGYVSLRADATPDSFGQKVGLDKVGALDKSGDLSKDTLGVNVL